MKNTKLLRAMSGLDDELILRAAERPARTMHPVLRLKWVKPLVACLLLAIIIGVPYGVKQAGYNRPRTQMVAVVHPVTEETGTYTLSFTKAQGEAAGINLPMMFGKDLTNDQIATLFPHLASTHTAQAWASFFYADGTLHSIRARFTSSGGLTTEVHAAVGQISLDYVLSESSTVSNIMGIPVSAGFFITKPNSRGERNIIYFASFEMDGTGYYADLGGPLSEDDTLRREFSEVLAALIIDGPRDIGAGIPSQSPR